MHKLLHAVHQKGSIRLCKNNSDTMCTEQISNNDGAVGVSAEINVEILGKWLVVVLQNPPLGPSDRQCSAR